MATQVEVHYRTSSGTERTETVDIEDNNGQAGIQADEIEAQAGEALRRKMQEQLTRGDRTYLPGEIAIDSFRYRTSPTQWNADQNHRTQMPSIFRFRIDNQRVDAGQSSPYKAIVGSGDSGEQISFHSDGIAGTSAAEAWEVADGILRRHGFTLTQYLENPGILHPNPDTDDARRVRELLTQEVSMGSDGRAGLTLDDVITAARADSRAPSSARIGQTNPIGPDGTATSNPDFQMTGDDAILRFINDPSQSNMQAVDRKRASIGDLIAMLMAALQGGNTDVLTSIMDLIATRGQATVAIVSATTARMLIQNDQEARRLGEELNRVMGQSATGTDATTRRQADITRLQQSLQQNSYARQTIVSMVQTTTSTMESINNTSRTFREAWERAVHAGWLR